MKFIEDIRDRHKGEEIWVIGAGPSLDEYPIDFFKDKICVGMNWVFSVFLDVGDGMEKFGYRVFYSVHEHREHADWLSKHKPHFLKNCFFLLPPSRVKIGSSRMVWWEDYSEDPYYIRWGPKGVDGPQGGIRGTRATDQDFRDTAKCIAEGGDCYYFCRGTTLHWAVQAAAVLGAKKIYVVGGEARGSHMKKHGSLYTTKVRPKSHGFISIFHAGTRSLATVFKPYGIEIVYYYYGKGEQAP